MFKFHIRNLSYGWCRVVMYINDKLIEYNASYLGPNPLATLIDACVDLMVDDGNYYITWQQEPGSLQIDLTLEEKILYFDIINHNGTDNEPEWHEKVPFEEFVSAIQAEGFRILNAFGLYGYQCSWQDNSDFPLTNLLRLTGKFKQIWKGDSCTTSIQEEIDCLSNHISKLEITEEKHFDECTVFYESWQLQCCGDPFAVGDIVEWTCLVPSQYKNAHGIPIDFDEDHHGSASHSISGTVSKIIAERSEFPKGKREVWYNKATTIQEELKLANGKESDYPDDDTTERTFWGYIVLLTDVKVEPIKNDV